MLILDNLIFRWQKSGGISSVWYELSKRIIEHEKDYLFMDYKNSSNNYFRQRLTIPNEKIHILNDNNFFIKKYLPITCDIDYPFIFHSSYYRTCNNKNAINIITLHDFTYEYFRTGLSKFIHCMTKYKALRNADYIVCISNNTKKDLMKFLPDINSKKIKVIYNGVSNLYYSQQVNKEDVLLFVGARDKYKNFDLAVISAAKANMPLIICGKELTPKEKDFLNLLLPHKYYFKGFVSNEELNTLYNKAYALLYPSSYEGFGIPIIEAQKAGCPVIATNQSSIPEIIGNKELLINQLSSNDIIEKLKILKDPFERKHIIELGFKNAQRFSWDTTYYHYKKLYQYIEQTTLG